MDSLNKFLLFAIIFTIPSIVLAKTFAPVDTRIGDSTINYVNPEISPSGNYMIWIEIDTLNGVSGKVWQCGIDHNTGDLIPSNGKGFSPFYSNIYSRPADWGVDSLGVYYVGATFLGQIKFVRPTSPTTATVTNIAMPIVNKRRVFYPSQLPNVNKRFVTYILNDSVNGFSSSIPYNSYYQLRLLDLDNPANDYLIEQQPANFPQTAPMDVIVPRWIKGSQYLTFGYKDGNNKAQAKEFNAFAPLSPAVPVTNDLSNKVDGYPVLNPVTGEQYFMSGINATDTAYFYKRTDFGKLFVKNEIIVPQTINLQTPSFNQSHEPFYFKNQLYSTFQINNNGGNFFETTFNQPGEIWLTTIDSSQQTMWLLSQYIDTLSISEPEPYVGNNKVWVYYSAVKIDVNKPYLKRQFQLRRCETPFNQTNINDSIVHNGLTRNYIVHLPPDYIETKKYPLVMVLEGGGKEGAPELIVNNHFDEIGDTAQFISVFPSGYYSNWADGRGVTESDKAHIDDVGFLNALVDTISSKFSVDANRVYVCGASNGGMMTQRLAIETPEKFAGFASIVSSAPDSLLKHYTYRKNVNMLIMNGTNDKFVPYTGGELNPITDGGSIIGTDSTLNFWLRNNQCSLTPLNSTNLPDINPLDGSTVTVIQYDTCNQSEVMLYKINGGGHTIPGRQNIQNPALLVGYTNLDIDGAVEIWKFFRRHTNQTLTSGLNKNFEISDLRIYPNPTNGLIEIKNIDVENNHVEVYNSVGKKILQNSNISIIDISYQQAGVYLIVIRDGNNYKNFKVIKQ